MDTQRLILLMVFAFSVVMLANEWHNDQRPAAPAVDSSAAPAKSPDSSSAVPTPTQPLTQGPPPGVAALPQGGQGIHVQTDLLSAEIDTAGGTLRRLELLEHRDTLDNSKNFVLLHNENGHIYVAQSGLIGNGLPDHRTLFTTKDLDVKLAPDAQQVSVSLQAPVAGGISVSKIYTFHRGSYAIDVAYEIDNKSGAAIQPDAYFQLVRDSTPPAGDSSMLPTFTGMAVYTDKEKFHKIPFSDLDKGKFSRKSDDGWIAALQHYFLSAWLPGSPGPRELYAQRLDNGLYAAGVIVPVGTIAAGQSTTHAVTLYAGPQEQDKLSALAPGLEYSVDYGRLSFIATPLFWVLQWIHRWCGNWGFAIIILTCLLKLLFYPLSAASYRSMARMRLLAPRMQRLKEQYGDDRQRMNLAMMELYKTEKVNPLGGCLPVVVQIPVFIALYWVLLASVELRHAPFMLWIHDLSARDPYMSCLC